MLALLVNLACHPHEPQHPIHPEPGERGSAFVADRAPPQPLLEVPLLALAVADDDGARRARVSAAHVARWVAFANDVYRPAGIHFLFDPRAFLPLQSSPINDLMGAWQSNWGEAKRAADRVAERYPDRLVVLFRHGPGAQATGLGFSSTEYNFVVMPGWLDDSHCGHEHLSSFAHEVGHHLGLQHTFVHPFDERSQAAAFLGQRGGDVNAFDGDGLSDTAPDPSIRSTECLDFSEVELGGVRIPLARRNIMSYYDQPDSLSAEQIQRLRWFLLERRAHHMKLPKNQPTAAMEVERLPVTALSGGSCWPQEMGGFGVGNWSEGRQLFCHAQQRQLTLRLQISVDNPGLQRLELYATRAPDFGTFQVLLDGTPLGVPYDAWAPAVLASGALPLGERRLEAGMHELTFSVRTKNRASTGYHLGLDALVLVPVEPIS